MKIEVTEPEVITVSLGDKTSKLTRKDAIELLTKLSDVLKEALPIRIQYVHVYQQYQGLQPQFNPYCSVANT